MIIRDPGVLELSFSGDLNTEHVQYSVEKDQMVKVSPYNEHFTMLVLHCKLGFERSNLDHEESIQIPDKIVRFSNSCGIKIITVMCSITSVFSIRLLAKKLAME